MMEKTLSPRELIIGSYSIFSSHGRGEAPTYLGKGIYFSRLEILEEPKRQVIFRDKSEILCYKFNKFIVQGDQLTLIGSRKASLSSLQKALADKLLANRGL